MSEAKRPSRPRGSTLQQAVREFLRGTLYRSPEEAIKAGARTLEQWSALLEQHSGGRGEEEGEEHAPNELESEET